MWVTLGGWGGGWSNRVIMMQYYETQSNIHFTHMMDLVMVLDRYMNIRVPANSAFDVDNVCLFFSFFFSNFRQPSKCWRKKLLV